jgi:predicted AlkP superfamily pyrophosphatase or phosphodiesterase
MVRRRIAPLTLAALVCLTLEGCAGTHPVPAPSGAAAPPRGSGGVNQPDHLDKPHVVLVSLDGFRADYLDRADVPNLRRVMQRGARATALLPVFPSLTFPNHYSLITGLNADRHGIVSNAFYDPARGQSYALGNRDTVTDGTWYRGEPIWVTAETQGMVASCFFWPGSEAAIRGVRPTEWREYNSTTRIDERVTTAVEWLGRPAGRRPHFIALYFSHVDSASHAGPLGSPAVDAAVRAVDGAVGALLDGIDALPIRNRVYLIITSDHGMVETTPAQSVRLDTLVSMEEIAEAFGGPVANLHVREAPRARAVRDAVNAKLQHGRAYLRKEVPTRHHYRDDPRIGDVVVIMEESWMLAVPPRQAAKPSTAKPRERWGMHGWDPAFPSMHAIFVASGPGIPPGTRIPAVRSVDIYPFMTALLGLRAPAGIDGRLPSAMRAWVAGPSGASLQLLQRDLPAVGAPSR